MPQMRHNLPLFLVICLTLCSVRVVVGSRKRKSTTSLFLIDTHNRADVVLPKNQNAMILCPPRKRVTARPKEPVPEKFSRWMERGNYEKIVPFCGKPEGETWKHLWPLITTPDHYANLFRSLNAHEKLPSFLVYGNWTLARIAIIEFRFRSEYYIKNETVDNAVTLSLNEDQHERAIGLLEAMQRRCVVRDGPNWQQGKLGRFESFLRNFFGSLGSKENIISIKRFLTLYGEVLNKRYRGVFESFCKSLAFCLKVQLWDSSAQKLLSDLIGQSFTLTPSAFARGFLSCGHDTCQPTFLEYSWREAVAEGLEGKCSRWR